MIRKILVPVDGSDHSKKALVFACDMAERYDASIDLIHVLQVPEGKHTMELGAAAITTETPPEELKEAGRKVIQAAAGIVKALGCKLGKRKVKDGAPAEQILDHSTKNDIDIIIMGNRGLSNQTSESLGSVADRVSHLAECTCVTMR
ncbi:MAG: universal stress protein [Gammaproteobacteria bacterium]|nr:universal stress protein [Gammaproteobacteria bacterium]